jgi:NADH-quinone oxidoreductase subunit M
MAGSAAVNKLLTLTTFLPLLGAVMVLAGGRGLKDEAARWVALGASIATFIVSLVVLGRFDPSAQEPFQMVEQARWVESIGLTYTLGVDGVSIWMVLLTTFLFPVSILASWPISKDVRRFLAAMLVLETAVIGTFVALDLLLFFLFFEALLVPMYLLIGGWGGRRRVYAAIKFFLFTMAGSAFLLLAILFLYSKGGAASFRYDALLDVAGGLPATTARWLFLAFFVAFAVKVPLVPLHTWLPDAHTEAPTAGSVLLAALLLKVGTYGLIRFNLVFFPEASRYFATFVGVIAVIGIVYGAVNALIQTDIKRLVAYSSVSHLGFVVLGVFAFTQQGVTGGVLQMVNHGLATGALFLLVGMVYERTHTRDLASMGGLASVMPWLMGAFLFTAFASAGLPGLNGFVGEFLVIVGTFAVNSWFGALAATAVVLAAIYLLWSYQRMAFGPVRAEHRLLSDVTLREVVVLAPVLALLLVFGVAPSLLTDRIDPATEAVIARVSPAHRPDLGIPERAMGTPSLDEEAAP